MIFLQKIFSLISPTNDVCPSIRFFVIRKFRFTLPASNEVNWSASLWTWSANTVMCVAIHGSWTEQDWQRHFDYGVQQIISRHPHILLTLWVKKNKKKQSFFFFLRVSLLLWPAIIGTPVQAYAGALERGLFTSFCCSLINAERSGAVRDGSFYYCFFFHIHHLIKCFNSSTLTVHSDSSILSYISNDNELALALPLTLILPFNCEAAKGTSTDKHRLPVVYLSICNFPQRVMCCIIW